MHAAIKYIRDLTAENDRLRAENRELADRPNRLPERSTSGEVAFTGATNDHDDDKKDVALKAEAAVQQGE